MPYKVIDGVPKFFPETKIKWTKKYRNQRAKESYKLYGHWQYFIGYAKRKKKGWIEQYDRSADSENRNYKIGKKYENK